MTGMNGHQVKAEEMVYKATEWLMQDFSALIQSEIDDIRISFSQKGEWMVSPPINAKSPLLIARDISVMGLMQPRIDAATAEKDGALLQPRSYQFIDPTGKKRTDAGCAPITEEVFARLLKMGDGPPGANDHQDPLDPEVAHATKHFVMRISAEEYTRLPLYAVARNLLARAQYRTVCETGRLIEGHQFDELILRTTKNISALLKEDATVQAAMQQYCPAPEDRTHVLEGVVAMLKHTAQRHNMGAQFSRHEEDIRRAILPDAPHRGIA